MRAARSPWVLSVVVAACAVLLLACPPDCGPANCSGCCADGECLSGKARLACGGNGLTCSACGASEVCRDFLCVPAPDAGQTRPDAGVVIRPDGGVGQCVCPTGCCSATGQCLSGSTPDACGTDGGRCGSCAARELCSRGGCSPVPECPGCTFGDGRCGDGNTVEVCGRDAGLCQRCSGSERCVDGRCTGSCTSATCVAGCCSDAVTCVTPPTSAACGVLGRACVACDAGLACSAGACL